MQPTLEDINLTVRMGELVGVLGRVGQGKTSLLSAIVGEMTRREGEVLVNGAVAYAPQNPWSVELYAGTGCRMLTFIFRVGSCQPLCGRTSS